MQRDPSGHPTRPPLPHRRRSRPPGLGLPAALLCGALAALPVKPAHAAPPERVGRAAETLLHGDPASAKRALAKLANMQGMPAAARALRSALQAGLPDALVVPALEAIASLGGPDAFAALSDFAGHRRVAVRLAAYQGLIGTATPTVPAFLENGLRDSDPRVRALCARGLGDLGARDRVDVLLLALARGVYAAAPAIGQLGDGPAAVRYTGMLERLPLPVMLDGYRAFLTRTDFASEDKVAIVARLTEVASPEVKRFLQTILVAAKWRHEPEVKKAIELAIQRIATPPPAMPAAPAQPQAVAP